jgi:hypothetical protein
LTEFESQFTIYGRDDKNDLPSFSPSTSKLLPLPGILGWRQRRSRSIRSREAVFEAWNHQIFFEKVHIGANRELKWNDEIELCSDSLYLKVTGQTPEELFPKLRNR